MVADFLNSQSFRSIIMKNISKKAIVCILLVGAIAIGAFAQQRDAQHEDEEHPTNLKVLPKNISSDSLDALMHEYTKALGVRCGFCHAPSASNPDDLDFASDANGKKKVARFMIMMTSEINDNYFAEANYGSKEKMITCNTCHRGEKLPPLPPVDSARLH